MTTVDPADASATPAHHLRERLEEAGKTPQELAEALEVPVAYVNDLLSGRRRLPLPARTDLYPKITSFCKLGRTELETWVRAERQDDEAALEGPSAEVRAELLAMCEPATAKKLEKRGVKDDDEELIGYFDRILSATKSAVRRSLNDATALRIAARRAGETLEHRRLAILDFLDTSPAELTADHMERFVRPQLSGWDVDLDTGVLRVLMQ